METTEEFAFCVICKKWAEKSETVPDERDKRFKGRRACETCYAPILAELEAEDEAKRVRRAAWASQVAAAQERKQGSKSERVAVLKGQLKALEGKMDIIKAQLRIAESAR